MLHTETFRTPDGKGKFTYNQYKLRESNQKLVNNEEFAKMSST